MGICLSLKKRIAVLGVSVFTVMATLGHVSAHASSWPQRPVEVIVPYTPGGATDTVTRAVLRRLSEELGETFVINNRPGANATIGTGAASRAKPDGYTFVAVLAAHTVNPHLYSLPYTFEDFDPVAHIADLPLFLFVSNELPVDTLDELIEYGKTHPGELTYGSSGAGSSAHLTTANFAMQAGLDMVHVPYKGSAPILMDLLEGRVSMAFDPILVPMSYVKEGRLKVLGVSSSERWQDEPEVPTLDESGFPGFSMSSWVALLAPAGTPQDIIDTVSAHIAEIVQEPGIQESFAAAGFVPVGGSASELQELIEHDTEMYGKIITEANISLN